MLTRMRILGTGAGRAIGAATALELTQHGHEVVASARDVGLLESLDVAQRIALDVTDERSVEVALREIGEVDAVVNNAALGGSAPLECFSIEHLRQMFETNTIGPLRLVQRLTPGWRERGHGVIVNISSVQGRVASPLDGAYSATKFALEALSEAMHYELGHFGVRVVLIEPGYIAPGMKPLETPLAQPEWYEGLYEQWRGTDQKVTGPNGRPEPAVVAVAVRQAIEDPSTPLRVPVGDDAQMILAARSQLDDQTFESQMRSVLDLTW